MSDKNHIHYDDDGRAIPEGARVNVHGQYIGTIHTADDGMAMIKGIPVEINEVDSVEAIPEDAFPESYDPDEPD